MFGEGVIVKSAKLACDTFQPKWQKTVYPNTEIKGGTDTETDPPPQLLAKTTLYKILDIKNGDIVFNNVSPL